MNKQPQDSPRNWSIFLLTSGVICKNNSKNKGIIQVKGKKAKFKHRRHHRYRNTQWCQGTITPTLSFQQSSSRNGTTKNKPIPTNTTQQTTTAEVMSHTKPNSKYTSKVSEKRDNYQIGTEVSYEGLYIEF